MNCRYNNTGVKPQKTRFSVTNMYILNVSLVLGPAMNVIYFEVYIVKSKFD